MAQLQVVTLAAPTELAAVPVDELVKSVRVLARVPLRVITEQIGWVLLVGPFLAVFMRHARRFMGKRMQRADAGQPAAAR